MKRFFFVLMTVLAVSAVSCKKDNNNNEQNEEKQEEQGPKFRIKTLAYTDGDNLANPEDAGWYDTWYYSYDNQGRVVDVDRKDGDSKHWVFTYTDNKVTITRKDNLIVYNLILNTDGVCTSIESDVKEGYDEWAPYKETAVFEYDATLRNTKITKEGELRSVLTWRDNCLVNWTKAKDNDRKRSFTYNTTKNVGDLHAIYSEAVNPPARWMYETGLFGHGPAYLPMTSVWDDDPENTASTITCKTDDNGYCIEEKKVFGGGWTEYFVITWEEIK